jgi:predicted transcriptional regulator
LFVAIGGRMDKKGIFEYRRDVLNLSRSGLAKEMGVSTSLIRQCESGDKTISDAYIEKMTAIDPEKITRTRYTVYRKRRTPEEVEKIDAVILEKYYSDGGRVVAEELGEEMKYIHERAAELRDKGRLTNG